MDFMTSSSANQRWDLLIHTAAGCGMDAAPDSCDLVSWSSDVDGTMCDTYFPSFSRTFSPAGPLIAVSIVLSFNTIIHYVHLPLLLPCYSIF